MRLLPYPALSVDWLGTHSNGHLGEQFAAETGEISIQDQRCTCPAVHGYLCGLLFGHDGDEEGRTW